MKWTDKEIAILRKHYPEKETLGCLPFLKNRSPMQIRAKAYRIGLRSNNFNKWSAKEVTLLKHHWQYSSMKELLKTFPNRTYAGLMIQAQMRGFKSIINRKRIGSFDFLNELNPKSCYWWGFIIADGHLTSKGELILSVNFKDKAHLNKLAKHLGVKLKEQKVFNSYCKKKPYHYVVLRIQQKTFGDKWLKELNINSPKTYTPPNLKIFLTKENLLAFFIGLVDGDGCIWLSKSWLNLRIELHFNWFNTLQLISEKLKEFYNIDSKVKITKKHTAKIDINTKKSLAILAKYINNIEYLKRKWRKLL